MVCRLTGGQTTAMTVPNLPTVVSRRLAIPLLLAITFAHPVLAETVLRLAPATGEAVELSLEDIESLPQTAFVAQNEFVDAPTVFRGPLVRDVLALGGLHDAEIVRFTALNDYSVDIPTSDFANYDAILAVEANGRRLSRRDKGPLWLVYPMDSHPELQQHEYVARLIWQVVRVEVP
jgi:hypothetical protein